MKYMRLVEECNRKLLEKDIKKAVELMLPFIRNEEETINLKALKDELFSEKDIDNLKNTYRFRVSLDKTHKDKKYIGKKQEVLGKVIEWLQKYFNEVGKKLDDEKSKELLISLKKEKGFKGNVLVIN